MAGGTKIELGDTVVDRITGFEGVVTAITDYADNTRRICVQGRALKDHVPTEPQWFDEYRLELRRKRDEGP